MLTRQTISNLRSFYVNRAILIFSLFAVGLLLSLISLSDDRIRAAPSDNASCTVKAQKVTDGRLKVTTAPPSKAELGTVVQVIASVKTNLFQNDWNNSWGELRLCIQDPKTNQWSLKKTNWSLSPPKSKYTYGWNTGRSGPNAAQSNPGPHPIKVIAIDKPGFLLWPTQNLYDQTMITLEEKETVTLPPPVTPAPPPVPDGGVDPGSGSGGQPPPGSTGPTPPGSGPDGEQPSGSEGAGGSTSPLFGAQAIRDYFVGLANPQNIPDLVIKIITFLLGMIAFAAFGAIIIGGIQYMTSLGNEEKAATAKRTIVYAVIGVIISISLMTIISVISQGLNNLF